MRKPSKNIGNCKTKQTRKARDHKLQHSQPHRPTSKTNSWHDRQSSVLSSLGTVSVASQPLDSEPPYLGFFRRPSMVRSYLGMPKKIHLQYIPSGQHTKNYGKSPFLNGNSTISMAMFNSKLFVYQRVTRRVSPFPSPRGRRDHEHKGIWELWGQYPNRCRWRYHGRREGTKACRNPQFLMGSASHLK